MVEKQMNQTKYEKSLKFRLELVKMKKNFNKHIFENYLERKKIFVKKKWKII